jgi:ABC-2 type transport system ATP-binding protein
MVVRPAVEACSVSKRFGSREALRDVDFSACRGQLHGLLGPNGAGKTTLMRVLLGLVRRESGTIRLLGRDTDDPSAPLPDGVAALIETPAFYPYLSGRANLELLARLDNNARSRAGRIDQALEQTGLVSQGQNAVGGYSAGMRQRLGLAAALIRSPQLLFLDEPTSALDPAGARDVRALARRLADEGAAVVLSSHDMTEVEDLCTTLTVINGGRVVFSGTVDELRTLAPAAAYVLRTSDDRTALRVAVHRHGLNVMQIAGSLEVSAPIDVLDAYVVGLGRAGVAVRHLERRTRSLESLFLDLTGHADRVSAAPAPVDVEPLQESRVAS